MKIPQFPTAPGGIQPTDLIALSRDGTTYSASGVGTGSGVDQTARTAAANAQSAANAAQTTASQAVSSSVNQSLPAPQRATAWANVGAPFARLADFTVVSPPGQTATQLLQMALDSAAPELQFHPPSGGGAYSVDPILLRPQKRIFGTKQTVISPRANGQKVFYTNSTSGDPSQSQRLLIENLTLDAGSFTGVTLMDLPEVRNDAKLSTIRMRGASKANGTIGLRLPELNWNTRVQDFDINGLGTGIRLEKNAACLVLDNCTIQNCQIGYDLDGTDQSNDRLTEVVITGAQVVQLNDTGVRLQSTTRVTIDTMHFENNSLDIDASGDDNLIIRDIAMRGSNTGLTSTGIKLRNTLGTQIRYPAMAGIRQNGFFDVDTSNFDARLYAQVSGSAGTLLNNSFLSYPGNTTGLRCMADPGVTWLTSQNPDAYRFAGLITANVPNGSFTVTPVNYLDGQSVLMMFRLGSTWTSGTITFAGYPIDMTNAAANKLNVVELIKMSSVGGFGYVLKSVSGWLGSV